jgi:hypothetical protein
VTITQTEIQDRIVAKAGEDGEFRARLLADPRAAIEEAVGGSIPDTLTVQVHEESATSFHLVLPPDSQLTEEEMSQVFAGDSWQTWADGWSP